MSKTPLLLLSALTMLTGMTTGGKTSDASLMESPVKTTNVKRANDVSSFDVSIFHQFNLVDATTEETNPSYSTGLVFNTKKLILNPESTIQDMLNDLFPYVSFDGNPSLSKNVNTTKNSLYVEGMEDTFSVDPSSRFRLAVAPQTGEGLVYAQSIASQPLTGNLPILVVDMSNLGESIRPTKKLKDLDFFNKVKTNISQHSAPFGLKLYFIPEQGTVLTLAYPQSGNDEQMNAFDEPGVWGLDSEDCTFIPGLIDNGSYTIQVNSDSHYTEDEILELVTAQDLFGQPCDIEVLESDYKDAVGTYTIKLQATDDYGQTATCTLKVVVLDRTAPVVVKKGDHTINYGQVVNEADIFACISATDNSGAQPTNSIYNNGGFSHFGTATTAADVGTYTIVVRTKDASGNYVDTNITLKVLDKTAPVISKKTGTTEDQIQYGFSESYGLTEQALLSLYTATDEVDGSVDLYVKSGEVTNSIGQHNITIAARDDAGNESSLVVNYVIRADIPPVFILDERLVLVSNENPLTKEQIKSIVEAMAPEGATYITLNEEDVAKYSSGAELVGETFRINYNYQIDGEEEIKSDYITLEIDEVETEESHGWWDTFIHFWKVLWDVICDFFTGGNPSWSNSWEEVAW